MIGGMISKYEYRGKSETPYGSSQHLPTTWFRADASWGRAVVHLSTTGSSSPSSAFALLADTHVLAGLGVAAELQIIGLGGIHLHVFALQHIVLGLVLESLGLLLPLLLLNLLLFMVSYQLELFFVVCLTAQSGSRQPTPVVDSWLPLQEEVHVVVSKDVHFIVVADEAESSEQVGCTSEAHDFGFDGIVGGFDAAVLLFERVADDAG